MAGCDARVGRVRTCGRVWGCGIRPVMRAVLLAAHVQGALVRVIEGGQAGSAKPAFTPAPRPACTRRAAATHTLAAH